MIENSLNQRSLIFLLISIALIALPHAWHLSLPIFGFFCLLLTWRFAAIWQRRWLPNRWLLSGLTLAGIAILAIRHSGWFGRDAGAALFVTALGLKLMEIRGKRDVVLVAYLVFIVAASQFLYEQSILMACYILAVCVALLAALVVQTAGWVPTWAAVKIAATITLQSLPLAVVIFVLFPRLEAPRWMWFKDDNKALSGLSDTLEPGAISQLSLSGELVFRVRFKGEIPPPRLRYWRGPVYSNTDGVRWSMGNRNKSQTESPAFSGKAYDYTLLMEPQKEDWVYALDMPESFDHSLHRDGYYQLKTRKRPSERAEYTITSRPIYNSGSLDKAEILENLQLPGSATEKQLALVEALGGLSQAPERFIDNLLHHFRREEFFYSLTPPLMPVNPIDTFLFETRSGFCSHYAAAFVYLLRVAKIPARVVGGYQGGQINSVGGFMEIRQADAHAWAEAWLDGRGWVRFDPTAMIAPERIERGVNIDLQIASGKANFSLPVEESAAWRWLKYSRHFWQSIDYNWQRWVINYRSVNQRQLLESLGIKSVVDWAKWLVGGVVLATLPLTWYLLRRKNLSTDKAVGYYRRFCDKLARAGIQIQVGEGAQSFAERVKKRRPTLSRQVEQITAAFIRLRYQPDAGPGDLQTLKILVSKLRV
ncbi:transglutaminase TgpA family protein [Methylomonas sp. MgM2]